MGSSYRTRELKSYGIDLRNANIQLSEFALAVWHKSARRPPNGDPCQLATERFAKLLQAIEEGDSTAADKILRSWRIRR